MCVCVDDFGLHAGVNEGAVGLAALRRVHAIGCLVGAEAWNVTWYGELRRLDPQSIDVGLHLDFTQSPLLPGSRNSLATLIARSLTGRLDPAAVRAEIETQLACFEQALGRAPSFVDGHQHVHQLPIIREQLIDELARRYPDTRPWLRSTRVGRQRATLKHRVIQWLGSRETNLMAVRMGFAQNRHLLGVYDFRGGSARYTRLLAEWIPLAGDADLLMCHAGCGRHEADPLGEARSAEYEVLASDGFGTHLNEHGMVLEAMSHILRRQSLAAQSAHTDVSP